VTGLATALRHRPALLLVPPRRVAARARAVAGERVGAQRLELLTHLVRRDFRLRYHGSLLGVLWIVLQPLVQLMILVFLFQRVVPLGIEAYPAFVFSGLLPWAWFSTSLGAAGGLFVGNRDLVRRPGFAPAVLVLVNVLSNFLVYLASLPLLVVLLVAYGRMPGPSLVLLPLVLGLEGVLVIGLGLAVATLNVFYRDVQQLAAVALSLLFYLTPVFYRAEQAGGAAHLVFAANPMAAVVAAHRALWLGTPPPWAALAGAAAVTALAAGLGGLVYRRLADELVDRL
jgi:ABC-type polysaccharide/polyol phosphate export permease